jgi:hypothetical protein
MQQILTRGLVIARMSLMEVLTVRTAIGTNVRTHPLPRGGTDCLCNFRKRSKHIRLPTLGALFGQIK